MKFICLTEQSGNKTYIQPQNITRIDEFNRGSKVYHGHRDDVKETPEEVFRLMNDVLMDKTEGILIAKLNRPDPIANIPIKKKKK